MTQKLYASNQALYIDNFGNPINTLKYSENYNTDQQKLKSKEVLLKILASPINPSDLNVIEGKYPLKPKHFPYVPGNEGVGEIVDFGNEVSGFSKGDHVVPLQWGSGMWQNYTIIGNQGVHKVPKEMSVIDAATILVNPRSAYMMLKNYVNLQKGDTIVQNGSTSAVGQAVIQICKSREINTINIVRDRHNMDETQQYLKGLGATIVCTEATLREELGKAGIPAPRLGLNCVGGSASTSVVKVLSAGGVMVTYGGMSMQPVQIPTGLLIFKNIECKGFWLSGSNITQEENAQLIDELSQLYVDKQMQGPRCQEFKFSDFKKAMEVQQQGYSLLKPIFKP